MTDEIDPASIDPNTKEGRAILVHICVYCHELKDTAAEANACEKTHEDDPDMSGQDRHDRFSQYEKKFLRRKYRGADNADKKRKK